MNLFYSEPRGEWLCLGPGFDLVFFKNSREYFLSTKALWKFSKVDSATAIADLPIRFGVITKVQLPRTSLSVVVRGGHFFLPLLELTVVALEARLQQPNHRNRQALKV